MAAILLLTCCSMDIWLSARRTVLHPTAEAVPGISARLYLHNVLRIQPGPTLPCLCHTLMLLSQLSMGTARQQSNDLSLLLGCLYLRGEQSALQEEIV